MPCDRRKILTPLSAIGTAPLSNRDALVADAARLEQSLSVQRASRGIAWAAIAFGGLAILGAIFANPDYFALGLLAAGGGAFCLWVTKDLAAESARLQRLVDRIDRDNTQQQH